ncbi:hypothetical protein [Lentzea sp. NPDC051838]|uniref:hypothetical protein n=1 Tax=Lentzea sp. NPDC051838 TaxID=3154849 RepID=UPI00343A58BE
MTKDVPAREAELRAMCRRALSGELSPKELTRWVRDTYRYGPIVLAQAFTDFDKAYSSLDYIGLTEQDVDEMVLDEVRRITS